MPIAELVVGHRVRVLHSWLPFGVLRYVVFIPLSDKSLCLYPGR